MGCQHQRQWQETSKYIYVIDFAVAIAVTVATAKWVPNPFQDDIIAVAIDAPPVIYNDLYFILFRTHPRSNSLNSTKF